MILLVAVFLTGILRNLPQPVLAAIVLMAVVGLVKVSAIRHLWRTDRQELLIVGVALAGVLTSGLLRGVLIGAVISMLLLIRRASRPHVAFLGRIPGSRRYSDMERHHDNEQVPEILIFRSEGSLLYFNADHIRDTVLATVRKTTPAPRCVICDLSAAPMIDLGGAEMLMGMETELRAMGVELHVVEARSSVRDKLRVEGIEGRIGRIDRFTTVADVVESLQAGGPGPGKVRGGGVTESEGESAAGSKGGRR
jgi:MFS superfamily sulfate permease-like transporter